MKFFKSGGKFSEIEPECKGWNLSACVSPLVYEENLLDMHLKHEDKKYW